MWELEAWASAMAWDWDTDNIDAEDDNGKLWVPIMAQTLNTDAAGGSRPIPFAGPMTPPQRQMTVYMVHLNQDGSAEQASMLVLMPVMMPQMKGWVVIKANLGQGESLREEDTTADEDGERELREAPAMPHDKVTKVKGKMPKMG